MMQNIKKQIFLIGLLLFSFIFKGTAQQSQNESDTSGFFDYKNFLNLDEISLYGKTKPKKLSTASISTVQSADFRSINSPMLASNLAGRLPGLMVSQGSGSPGRNAPWLQIRGVQTFLDGAAGITVLVDGFETDYNTVHPDEIESISVLKDAASLSLYGVSGANGILYIKTRRGQSTTPKVTFNSRVSFQQPTVMPEFLGNADFAELYNIAMVSDGKDIANGYFPTQTIVDNYKNGTFPILYPSVNWYDEILKPSAIAQDYTLSIRGGEDKTNYFVMLGYSNTPGLYSGTDGTNNSNWVNSRYMSRINLDFEITDWLRASLNTRGTMQDAKQPNADQNTLWRSMGSFMPFNVKTPSGNWGGTEGYRTNPVAQLIQQGYLIEKSRTIDADLKVVADIKGIKGLSIFGQVAFSNYYFWEYRKTRGMAYEELFPIDALGNYTSTIKGNTNLNYSYAQTDGTQWNRYTWQTGAEFQRKIGEGTLYASAIYSQELYKTDYSGNNVPFAKVNMMGRVNYSYKDKYIAEFGYSYAGSDNYAPGKRKGFFPAISGAWILSNESFLSGSDMINFLKVRASYGLTGNNRIGSLDRFPFYEYYSSAMGSYRIGNTLGTAAGTFEKTSYPNKDATWEKAYKANFGVDATILKNLSISADYFFENREDILVDPSDNISFLIGSRYTYINEGSAKNNGAEVQLTYSKTGGELSYYASAGMSYVHTEIIDSKEPPRAEDYLYRKGHPIDQPFVLEAIGFFADQADIDASPFQTFGTVKPGDIKYKDQNNDGFIDNNDVKAFGNPSYPTTMYSFDAGLEYIGFDLSVFLQGVTGRTISLLSNNQVVPFLNDALPVQWVKDNYWTTERGDNAEFPRLTTESNDNNYRSSTLWQRDGSYFRIKNIELGYTFSGLQKIGLRVYCNAVNILTLDKIDEINIDPEINNMFAYPMMKSYNIGFKLVF